MITERSNTVWAALVRFLPRNTLSPAPLCMGKLLFFHLLNLPLILSFKKPYMSVHVN